MLLYDLSHTSHSRARTGVQRVALALRQALRARIHLAEITYDPYRREWRKLEKWESRSLDRPAAATRRRGAHWPPVAQWRGWSRRLLRQPSPQLTGGEATGFFTPEIFTARTGTRLPDLLARVKGPRAALFHDAIPLRLPELAPASAVGRFPTYLAQLRQFDGIMTNSQDSKRSLEDYWQWAGWTDTPEITVLPFGADHLPVIGNSPGPWPQAAAGGRPRILSVGSLEGRKNHQTLLQACAQLWSRGIDFELQVIGTLQRETGQATLDHLRRLQSAGHPIRYEGWLSDLALGQAYHQCHFTVYPSLREGFGLPVWESLVQGKPCICSHRGATREIAQGGGCVTVDTGMASDLAEAMAGLLHDPDRLSRLTMAAAARTPPTWAHCAAEMQLWLSQLSRRAPDRVAF